MVRIQWVPITISDIKVSYHDENIVNINLNILKIFQDCLIFIWVDVNNKENNTVVKEWNEVNIPMVYDIFSKWEIQLGNLSINISNYSWMFIII